MLKNKAKEAELNKAIEEMKVAHAEFHAVQNKMIQYRDNIQKNKAFISALKAETEKLEAEAENISVSEVGEVDLASLDKNGEQIESNKRKIKALEKVIKQSEDELEYLLYTEYYHAMKPARNTTAKVFGIYGEALLAEFTQEIKNSTLHRAYKALCACGDVFDIASFWRNRLENILWNELNAPLENDDVYHSVFSPRLEFGTPSAGFERARRLEYLMKALNKTEPNEKHRS